MLEDADLGNGRQPDTGRGRANTCPGRAVQDNEGMDLLPELRWTAAALPATELTLVAVFSPEDQTVRASGVAVPEDSEPPAAAIGRLLETLMDRLVALDPETADREMNPRPVEPRPGVSQPVADALAAYAAGDVVALDALDVDEVAVTPLANTGAVEVERDGDGWRVNVSARGFEAGLDGALQQAGSRL